VREHHSSVFAFVFNEFHRLKSDTASDTILSF